MTTSGKLASLLLLLAVMAGSPGCGDKGDVAQLGLVTGNVTLDGKPFSEVKIAFQPAGDGLTAMATVDEDGHYELIYTTGTKGAVVGSNIVRFFYDTGETGPLIPKKYSVRASEGEKVKVNVAAGANTFDFALESDQPGSDAQEPIID